MDYTHLDLNSIANIVKNIRNPKLPVENDSDVEYLVAVETNSGKSYRIKTRVKEIRGKQSNKAYVYEIEEIEITSGLKTSVSNSKPDVSSRGIISIPVANIYICFTFARFDSGQLISHGVGLKEVAIIEKSFLDSTTALAQPQPLRIQEGITWANDTICNCRQNNR